MSTLTFKLNGEKRTAESPADAFFQIAKEMGAVYHPKPVTVRIGGETWDIYCGGALRLFTSVIEKAFPLPFGDIPVGQEFRLTENGPVLKKVTEGCAEQKVSRTVTVATDTEVIRV